MFLSRSLTKIERPIKAAHHLRHRSTERNICRQLSAPLLTGLWSGQLAVVAITAVRGTLNPLVTLPQKAPVPLLLPDTHTQKILHACLPGTNH